LDIHKQNHTIIRNITCYKSDLKNNVPEGKLKKGGGSQASPVFFGRMNLGALTFIGFDRAFHHSFLSATDWNAKLNWKI
jgi:hypothetical protein